VAVSGSAESPCPVSGVKVLMLGSSLDLHPSAVELLSQAGCVVLLAYEGFAALASISDHQPDV
jgi:twitching motility two-component system response regulator PilG